MALYIIEKGVPIPHKARVPFESRFPFLRMEHGDSIFVPLNGEPSKKVRANILRDALTTRRRHSTALKLLLVDVTEKGVEGIRVWRMDGDEK